MDSKCSKDDLVKYLRNLDFQNSKIGITSNYADEFLSTGKWPNNEIAQIPKSSSVLKSDGSGEIDWSEAKCGGYTTKEVEKLNPFTGKVELQDVAIKEEFTPEVGEIIDRYGPSDGRYTSPTKYGEYTYEQRSLPYLDDKLKYHKYKVEKDFSKLKDIIEGCTDINIKNDIDNIVKKFYKGDYDLLYKNLKGYKGEIASAFDSIGGGIQYELPLSVDMLIRLGFLAEIK